MISIFNGKKRSVHECERLDIADFMHTFLCELMNYEVRTLRTKTYRIRTEAEAERIRGLINSPTNPFKTVSMIQGKSDEWQEVVYKPANLGVGFVFFFVCTGCERHVRHLYQSSSTVRYKCRICLNLGYYRPKLNTHRKPSGTAEIPRDLYVSDGYRYPLK